MKLQVVRKAEKPFDFRCEIASWPQAIVRLLHRGEACALTCDIESYDDFVSVRMKHLRRRDSGKITVTATNEHGQSQLHFQLKVSHNCLLGAFMICLSGIRKRRS